MNRPIFLILIFTILFSFANLSANPFSGDSSAREQQETLRMDRAFILKITMMQQNIKYKMSSLITEFKEGGSFIPLFSVLMLSFFYGVLHAAGPGHGKSFAAAYTLSEKPKVLRGVAFGSSIAFFHGITGALLVLLLNHILQKTITGSVANVEYYTKIISYSLLSILGFILFVKAFIDSFKKDNNENNSKNIFIWSFSAGLIPCPGVIMIMLFCLSIGMPYFGFILALAVSAGMALTICLVIITITMGKKFSYNFLSEEKIEKGEMFLSFISGFFVMTIGLIFLCSTFKSGTYFV